MIVLMKKIILTILLITIVIGCNKKIEVSSINSTEQQVAWDQDTTSYDATQIENTPEDDEVSNGPTEWIWDGSQYDTLYVGATLRISNIDGDKVYLTMSK